MITTGIVTEINSNIVVNGNNENYGYKVEIPIYRKPGEQSSNPILTYCCNQGGIYNSYKVGDKVFVGFFNNEMGMPIILGRINTGLPDTKTDIDKINNSRSYGLLSDLDVTNKVNLPKETTIGGDITYDMIYALLQRVSNLEAEVEALKSK